jgi:sugar/nucleoside kinase (ribokinase family)
VTPVDTTGAGDCFNAGLIAGLLRGLPLPQAAALGCATGALSTGSLGGTAGAPGLEKATDLAANAWIAAFALPTPDCPTRHPRLVPRPSEYR